jgi:predicted nucleic acid-binding protein
MTGWLMDTGPIVALLCADDEHHAWAVEQSRHAPPTVLTCEAVISEALFLLKRAGHDSEQLFAMVDAGFLRSGFDFNTEHRRVGELMRRYKDQPMAFADACLVRMTEMHADSCVWTLDSDFRFYRKGGGAGRFRLLPPELTAESFRQLFVNSLPVPHGHQTYGPCFLVDGVNNAESADAVLHESAQLAHQRHTAGRIGSDGTNGSLDCPLEFRMQVANNRRDMRRDIWPVEAHARRRFTVGTSGSPNTFSKVWPFLPES